MPTKNLVPGQFQIGDLVLGEHTPFKIESVDIGNYDVNVQDSQAQASNEITFGIDTFKPAPMSLTINILRNRLLPNIVALTGSTKQLNFDSDKGLHELQEEWRAEDTLMEWGEMKPLYFCGGDGIVRQFFGRPGKFAYRLHKIVGSEYYTCTAEFRRADTLAYSEQEFFIEVGVGATVPLVLTRGTAPSWLRILIFGPANRPTITIGTRQLFLDWEIPNGEAVEITSYPWLGRRVVDSNGISLAAYLTITPDPYLDKLRLGHKATRNITWNATDVGGSSKMYVLWHDGYQVMS